MKTTSILRKLSVVAGCVTLFCAVDVSLSIAAESPPAKIDGEVVAAIGISKTGDLNFGKFMPGTNGGTVIVAPADGARSKTVDVILVTGTASTAATFNVTGQAGTTYSITLPSTPITLSDGGGHTMSVGSFVSLPDATTTGTGSLASGAEEIKVGATLTVAGGQAAGSYNNSADFKISVDYN